MNEVIYTRAVLVTGCDAKDNEYTYWQVGDEWFDGYNEKIVTPDYIANHVWMNIVCVRFGPESLTRDEWLVSGCPLELNGEQMQALANRHAELKAGKTISLSTAPISVQVEDAYMQADLGTHNIIMGGDMLECGSPAWYAGIDEIPF